MNIAFSTDDTGGPEALRVVSVRPEKSRRNYHLSSEDYAAIELRHKVISQIVDNTKSILSKVHNGILPEIRREQLQQIEVGRKVLETEVEQPIETMHVEDAASSRDAYVNARDAKAPTEDVPSEDAAQRIAKAREAVADKFDLAA